jgi:hypothetical protein
MSDKSFIGGGKLHIDGRFVGNVPQLDLNFEVDPKELKDSTTPGGGLYNSLERISSVGFSFAFSDYNAENLAMALYGSSTAVASAVITDESITSPSALNRFVKTASLIDLTETYSVTSDPAGTTYVADVDYVASAGGILFVANIPVDTALLVNYTSLGIDLVQALVNSGMEHNFVFDGFNDAQSGTPVVVDIFRAKPSPAAGIPLISDDFVANSVTGKILKDTTKIAVGESQYFTVAVA